MKAEIVKNTFNKLLKNKAHLTTALLWPLGFLMILDYILPTIMQEQFGETLSPTTLIVPLLLINVIISVTTHRLFLLGDDSVPTWGLGKLTKNREVKFMINTFLLGFVAIIPALVIFFILKFFIGFSGLDNTIIIEGITLGLVVNIFLTSIAVAYILSRFSLVFPSTAVDEPLTFWQSWAITKDYQWIMFSSVIIFPVVFGIILTLVYGLIIGFLAGLISSHLLVLSSLLNLFITVFTIGFLSSAYEYIMNDRFHEPYYQEVERREQERKSNEPAREIKVDEFSNDTYRIRIHDAHDISFENLKSELLSQYEKLGFNDFAIDRENRWMLKNPEEEDSYIYLKYEDDEFHIETFGTEKPKLDLVN